MLLDKLIVDIKQLYPAVTLQKSNVYGYDSDNKIIFYKRGSNELLTVISILHELGHHVVHTSNHNYEVSTPTEMQCKIIEIEVMAWVYGRSMLNQFQLNTPEIDRYYTTVQAKFINSYIKALQNKKCVKSIYLSYDN